MDNIKKIIENFAYRIAQEITNEAQEQAPTITRNLRNDIKARKKGPLKYEVGNSRLAPYAKFVHNGTGIYGPKKRKIRPKRAKALKFKIRGKTICRKSVKGQRPNPYLRLAIEEYIRSGDLDRALDDVTQKILQNLP